MAPRTDQAARGRGGERRTGNANTGAGVKANRPTAGQTARGSGGRGRAMMPRPQRGRGGDLEARMTYDNGGGHLEARMTYDNDGGDGPQINTGAHGLAARMSFDGNVKKQETNDYTQSTTEFATNTASVSQGSALFCGSQANQAPGMLQVPLSSTSPSDRPVAPASSSRPIRMLNQPVNKPTRGAVVPKRPANKYRGKDPIKQRVQNPKLRAILAGRALPKERKKAPDDRPDLRMTAHKIYK